MCSCEWARTHQRLEQCLAHRGVLNKHFLSYDTLVVPMRCTHTLSRTRHFVPSEETTLQFPALANSIEVVEQSAWGMAVHWLISQGAQNIQKAERRGGSSQGIGLSLPGSISYLVWCSPSFLPTLHSHFLAPKILLDLVHHPSPQLPEKFVMSSSTDLDILEFRSQSVGMWRVFSYIALDF